MTLQRNISLSIAAIISIHFLAGFAYASPAAPAVQALCGGQYYPLQTVKSGAAPYIELSADGLAGQFLLDYGATASSISAEAFSAPVGAERNVELSLPGSKAHKFYLRHYDLPLQPHGQQLGIIGTEILSQLTVQFSGNSAFIGSEPCPFDALRARGLAPIAQDGFFSSDPAKVHDRHPNVPIVYLRLGNVHTWAQVDTGYEDIVYKNTIDINEPLFNRLVASGNVLTHLADIRVSTCEGTEIRQVYTLAHAVIIETHMQIPVLDVDLFHLILKPTSGCGGIGAMEQPAAQLGASFLKLFDTIVFDPKSRTVWLNRTSVSRP